ncbi:MAG: TolC family protein [candidate division KSB1 bacterium]|nr:TolC family protein [candidate division KSB1 bacterium]MDZ7319711.1 TolC family protein [candidate division KSB1 bacterium]MDZ7340901.1 TolC family protein [candidate division KSB1 bacterium]
MSIKNFAWLKKLDCWLLMAVIMSSSATVLSQESLTLERALAIAMANSPQIRTYQLNLERRQQLLNAQQAGLKSQFGLTLNPIDYANQRRFYNFLGSYVTSETRRTSGTFSIRQPIKWTDGTLTLINEFSWIDSYNEERNLKSKNYNNDLYLSFTQPIFTYNRTKMQLRQLELDLENAALNYAIQKLYLEYQVTQNFFNVYQQKMRLEIAKDEYNNREQSYQIIKNKVDAGLSRQEDLFQAELNLAESKSAVQNAQVALENYLDSFKKLIGMSLFADITVTADISHQPVDIDLQKALDTGLQHRMELRQRQISVDMEKYSLIVASATNEFRGDISLSYGITGTDKNFRQIYESENQTKNERISVELNIPLWDWGQKKSSIKAAEASLKNAELSLENEKTDIMIEIRNAYRNLKNLVTQIEIAEQNLRNAQLTYDINLERYKNGDLTSMDLNLFQNQLSQAKLNKISALINYKIELLNMKVLSLWDFERNQQVVPEEIAAEKN